jgi:hypothetical protein
MAHAQDDNDSCSGTLGCADGVLRYSRNREPLWELNVSELAVVGEFTVDAFSDDYFLVFVARDGSCFQSSFYATGRDLALETLSESLGLPLACGLCNSVELRSRVMWPASLADSPLLEEEPAPPTRLLDRARRAFGLGSSEVPLSDAVLSHLGIQQPGHAV